MALNVDFSSLRVSTLASRRALGAYTRRTLMCGNAQATTLRLINPAFLQPRVRHKRVDIMLLTLKSGFQGSRCVRLPSRAAHRDTGVMCDMLGMVATRA
eukprot:347940-Chlamydomonas_euryale.AAC.1